MIRGKKGFVEGYKFRQQNLFAKKNDEKWFGKTYIYIYKCVLERISQQKNMSFFGGVWCHIHVKPCCDLLITARSVFHKTLRDPEFVGDMAWYVWYGMVWYGMVWYGMVWYGMVWYGMVWYGMVWYGMVCMYVYIYIYLYLYVYM